MSVRRRTWANSDGAQGEAWVVNYTDRAGTRRLKSFKRKRDADAYHAQVGVDVRAGIHTADSRSGTVAEAGKLWIETATNAGLERSCTARELSDWQVEDLHQHRPAQSCARYGDDGDPPTPALVIMMEEIAATRQ